MTCLSATEQLHEIGHVVRPLFSKAKSPLKSTVVEQFLGVAAKSMATENRGVDRGPVVQVPQDGRRCVWPEERGIHVALATWPIQQVVTSQLL